MKNITNKYLEEPIYEVSTIRGSINAALKEVFFLPTGSLWELSDLVGDISGWGSLTFYDNDNLTKVERSLINANYKEFKN